MFQGLAGAKQSLAMLFRARLLFRLLVRLVHRQLKSLHAKNLTMALDPGYDIVLISVLPKSVPINDIICSSMTRPDIYQLCQ